MDTVLYYFGFNGFGQVAEKSDEICTTCPRRIHCSSEERSLRSMTLGLSWSHLFIVSNGKVEIHGGCCGNDITSVLDTKEVRSVTIQDNNLLTVDDNGVCIKWYSPQFKQYSIVQPYQHGTSDEVKIQQVAAGDLYTVCLTDDGKLQLLEEVATPGGCSLNLHSISLPVKVKSVSCGKEHVLVLPLLGDVYSFGVGSRGQLGHGQMPTPKVDSPRIIEALQGVCMLSVAAGGWHSAVISEFGDLYIWGWNESGQLGFPCGSVHNDDDDDNDKHGQVSIAYSPSLLDMGDVNIHSVSCGSRHTVCLTECGKVYSWGWNVYGQLGLGDTLTRDKPTLVDYFMNNNLHVEYVLCGQWSTVAGVRE